MLYGIIGANRRVTVYVDPEHGEFTSAEVIKDSLCRYLHEKGRDLKRNESITVKAAEGGCPLTSREIGCIWHWHVCGSLKSYYLLAYWCLT